MPRRWRRLLFTSCSVATFAAHLAALSAVVVACGKVDLATDIPDGEARAANDAAPKERPRKYEGGSFDPSRYSRACTSRSDCTIVRPIHDCSVCCGDQPVTASEARADYEAVMQVCSGKMGSCDMECERVRVGCLDQRCIACTERKCRSGVFVRTSITLPGTYVFEALIDGATMRCELGLPNGPPGPVATTCTFGAELVNQPSSDGSTWTLDVFFRTNSTAPIHFNATRNGALLGEKTITPAYANEPGPNGPGCEPATCAVHRTTLP